MATNGTSEITPEYAARLIRGLGQFLKAAQTIARLRREFPEIEAGVARSLAKRKGGRPKGYKTSTATRAKLRAAWKRRKAAAAGSGGRRHVAKGRG